MANRILIAYASWAGATAGVAEAVGKVFTEGGAAVDVLPANKVANLQDYSAVVLGTAVRAGKVNPQSTAFVQKHRQAMAGLPVAYFVVCLTMKDDTEENRCTVKGYLEQASSLAPEVQPVDVGLFAGAVDFKKLGWFLSAILKRMKVPEGDFRNWDAVRAWATGVLPKLTR